MRRLREEDGLGRVGVQARGQGGRKAVSLDYFKRNCSRLARGYRGRNQSESLFRGTSDLALLYKKNPANSKPRK